MVEIGEALSIVITKPNIGFDSTFNQVVILVLINQLLENPQDTILSQVETTVVEATLVVRVGDNFIP